VGRLCLVILFFLWVTRPEGRGIYLRTWQSLADKQFTPIYGVRIAGNAISNTTGLWASHIAAVFAMRDARPFGIGRIGVEIRDNRLTANKKTETETRRLCGPRGLLFAAEAKAGPTGWHRLYRRRDKNVLQAGGTFGRAARSGCAECRTRGCNYGGQDREIAGVDLG